MTATLNPYLQFMGNCKEAMEFYKSVLGGELKLITFGESGMTDEPQKDKIMHASIENGALTFMASDGGPEHPVKMGDNIKMSISGTDEEALRKYFDGLSAGGNVYFPLKKESWGDIFGMFIDKFGINWMVNISAGQQPQQ